METSIAELNEMFNLEPMMSFKYAQTKHDKIHVGCIRIEFTSPRGIMIDVEDNHCGCVRYDLAKDAHGRDIIANIVSTLASHDNFTLMHNIGFPDEMCFVDINEYPDYSDLCDTVDVYLDHIGINITAYFGTYSVRYYIYYYDIKWESLSNNITALTCISNAVDNYHGKINNSIQNIIDKLDTLPDDIKVLMKI